MSDVTNKRLNIYIDQASAELALEKLQKRYDKLTESIDKGKAAGKNMTAEIKKLSETEAAIKGVQEQIDKGLAPSIRQQSTLVNKLRNELMNLSQSDSGFDKKVEAYNKAKLELNRLNEAIGNVGKAEKSWLQEAKVVAFGVLVGNTVTSVVESIGGYFSGMISGNAKLSDSLSDIEKSTGLSASQVAKLNSELGKIDTRTATSDLREIAVGLGQIGEEANKANVAAIDQIVVALGDEFGGGAKEITTTLSVLRNNLQDIKTGDYATDVSRIGNAINTLGAEGLATAPVVTDIANRVAGVGQTFKLTSGQILGTAATFQELGIETERGSTAITKIFQKIGAEPEKFAKVAGMGIKEFTQLVNTDMLGAFEAVAQGVKKAGGNNVVFSQILKELDADGIGAGEVLSKLGANSELLTKKVDTATEALKSNASITDEFAKKNNNLAAELAKLNKDFESLIQSKSIADFFASGVRGTRNFISAIKAVPAFLKDNQTAIYLIITGLAVMNASYISAGIAIAKNSVATAYNTVVTKAKAAWDVVATASTSAYIVATNLLTGKITLATAAQRLWNIAISFGLGPIGLIIVAIGALAVALNAMPKTYSAAERAAQDFADVQAEANKAIIDERVNLSALLAVAKDETKSKQERQKAIDAINAKMPEYIDKLTLENVTTAKGASIINEYIEVLGKKALAQAYMSKLQELYNKQIEVENSSIEDNVKWYQTLWSIVSSGNSPTSAMMKNIETGVKARQESSKAIKDEIDLLKKKFDADLKNGKALLELPSTKKTATSDGTATNPFGNKADDKEAKSQSDLLKRLQDFKFELEQIGKDGDIKEIDRVKKKYAELMAEASQHGVSLIGLENEKNRAIAFLLDKEAKEQEAKRKKQFEELSAKEYENQQKLTAEYFERTKQAEAQRYANGEIDRKQYEINIGLIDLAGKRQQLQNAEDYSGTVKKAEEDLLVFKKNITKEEIDDAIRKREKLVENERLMVELQAKAAVARLENKVGASAPGTGQRYAAEKALRVEQERQAIAEIERQEADYRQRGIAFTTEFEDLKQKIRDEYAQKDAEADITYYTGKIDKVLGYIQNTLSILDQFNQARTAKENAQLNNELKANDKRRKNIEALQKNRVITEVEARKRLADIDNEEQKRKDELEKKQQARNKRIAIAQAIINGALAITNILATVPKFDFGVASAIQIGLAIATTAAQIATISGTKYAKGGVAQGASHAEGGIKLYDTRSKQVVGEMEGDEPYMILSKNFRRNNPDFIAAALDSSMNRDGARITLPQWQSRQYRPIDYAGITSNISKYKFATGGVVGSANAPAVNNDDTLQLLSSLVAQSTEVMAAHAAATQQLNSQLAKGIRGDWRWNELNDMETNRNNILSEANP